MRVLVNGEPVTNSRLYNLPSRVNGYRWTSVSWDDVLELGPGTHDIQVQVATNADSSVLVDATEVRPNVLRVTQFNQLPSPEKNNARTLSLPVQAMAGLDVHRELTVPDVGSHDFARTVDVFHNPTDSEIATNVRVVGNLGSDKATTVFATSSGDTVVDATDRWIGTDGGDPNGGMPAIIHYVAGPGGLRPESINVIGDNIEWTYAITVEAGETLRLAYFTILNETRAGAILAAEALVTPSGFGGEAAAFLTAAARDSLTNFQFNQPPIADAGGPYDVVVGGSVTLDASGSFDPDGDPLAFAWDLTGDGQFSDAFDAELTFAWEDLVDVGIDTAGDFEVAVRVDDGLETDVATATVSVLKAEPTLTIDWTDATYAAVPWGAEVSVIGFDETPLAPPTLTYFDGTDTNGTGFSTAPVEAGTYTVLVEFDGDGNHLAASDTAMITIAPASLTITADDKTKEYDGSPFTNFTVSYDGFVDGEDASVLGGELSFSGDAVGAVNAGDYTIEVSGLTSGNYEITFVDGELTIHQAPLTVNVADAEWEIGTAFPEFHVNIAGAIDGEQFAADAWAEDAEGAVVDETAQVGTYTITADVFEVSSGLLANYAVTLNPGALTVTPAQVEIDIRPESLNISANGTISLVILGAGSNFDLATIDLGGLRFAGADISTFNQTLADINGDGSQDLILHFRMNEEVKDAREEIYREMVEADLAEDGEVSAKQAAALELEGEFGEHEQQFGGSDAVDLFFSGRALRDLLDSLDPV